MNHHRGMLTERDFATFAWGDQFTLEDKEYTVLVVYPLIDQPGFNVVCLPGACDPATMTPNAGDELYLRITSIGDTLRVTRHLNPSERAEVERTFYTFMVFLGAKRITTANQPLKQNERDWMIVAEGMRLTCTKLMRVGYGDCGEYTADVFMGSQLNGDIVTAVYLVFLELTEENPDTYTDVDEETREMLYESIMKEMGYGVLTEDDIATEL